MLTLNPEQKRAVASRGNVVVTACPGSGKTRVLTARVIRGVLDLTTIRKRVVALTFTRRAAEEIQSRLRQENVPTEGLWAGTIHSFALDWILRPYAPYSATLRTGFSVADEFYTEKCLNKLKEEFSVPCYKTIRTDWTRAGENLNVGSAHRAIFSRYKASLRTAKLLDYDDILYQSYLLLKNNPEIAATLGAIIDLVCVDEVQDIQDLQFGILSSIFKATPEPFTFFFVGDPDQSIYESLGALTKTPGEIAVEFGLRDIPRETLKGNYRSTQRLIDFYRRLRPGAPPMKSLAKYAGCPGIITFQNQTISRGGLATVIAGLISGSLDAGVAPSEICVLAPQWRHVRGLVMELVGQLPDVDFDAPGLSPLHSSRDNLWFKLGRLFLTTPSPFRARARLRWAREFLTDLHGLDLGIPESLQSSRNLLRIINSIYSSESDGVTYLRTVFSEFLSRIDLSLERSGTLRDSFAIFFEKVTDRIEKSEGAMPRDVESFCKLFKHPSGLVVSSCHGAKGEEYDTVIAFGLLRGYIPHWDIIINGTDEEAFQSESRLLYVICSRAKRCLHLIAESGRATQRGIPYETSRLLRQVRFQYDRLR